MCEQTCSRTDRRTFLRAGAGVAGVVTFGAMAEFSPASAGSSETQTFTGTFTGLGTADWHYLPVKLPDGVREIEVSCEHVKTDTGLGFSANVVDIGIFDPSGHDLGNAEGFRGWSGGARTSFSISRTTATPGYLAGPMTEGVWHVILGPVQIIPPGVSWTVHVTLHYGEPGRDFVPAPAPRAVAGTTQQWYRGDLHTHTVHSDGRWTQTQLVDAALAAGLDFIASTEHNTNSAHLTWGRYVPHDFLVIAGEEITTRAGHWLAVGLPAGSWIDWRYRPTDGELARFTSQVRGLGGLAIAAHPWAPIPTTKWDFGYDYASMDAIEIWNGPWTVDDQVAVEAWHAMLLTGKFIPVVGNSDSHNDGQKVGLPQTVVRASSLSTGAIVTAVKGGHAWIAESSAVDLSFTARAGSRTASCGDRLGASALEQMTVELTVTGAPGCIAQIRGPLVPLTGGLADASGRIQLSAKVPAALASFVRAEVRRIDGDLLVNPLADAPLAQMVALTNPIFL